ncbi:MAG TPA: M23 family metallopeptidase, partial [Gemmatimonadales bacterium]|nr:M23 family metallopeptidase [Gemmatimonadales bacterium]
MTSRPHPWVTILIQTDGSLETRQVRMPRWLARALLTTLAGLFCLVVLAAAFYLPVAHTAARVPALDRRVARLEAENARIGDLARALDSADVRYARLRAMIGANVVPDPLVRASGVPVAPSLIARSPATPLRGDGATRPAHWPLDDPGYITRGQVIGGSEDQHPGLDIAVTTGSLVRATADGSVAETGEDPEYGTFVLLQHGDDYQSMYGHLSRSLVRSGQHVSAGEVIGLSGNTGNSSAPHLHFELRHRGQVVDPLTLVK